MKKLSNYNNFIKEGFLNDIVSGAKSSIKRNIIGSYNEQVWIWIKCFDNKCFMENQWLDGDANIKLFDILNDKFNLNFTKKGKYYQGSTFEFDYSKLDEISEYLISIGLERKNLGIKKEDDVVLFKGKISLKNLK